MQKRKAIVPMLLLIAITALVRLLPHAPNFTPVAAVAMFAAVYLSMRWAVAVPLLAMLVSDTFIGFYDWRIMLTVYGSLLLSAGLGWVIRQRVSVWSVAGASLAGSTLFFLLTNGAVWLFGTLYPKTATGLMEAYTMGLPFFRNTVLGDLTYAAVLFWGYATFMVWFRQVRPSFDLAQGKRWVATPVETINGVTGIPLSYGPGNVYRVVAVARISQKSNG